MWRRTEREKEQLLRSKMSKEKKSTNNRFSLNNSTKNAVAMGSLQEIPRKMINLENDSKDLTLGEGKFAKVTLASYRGMPVVVTQFNAHVLLKEIEFEAKIINSFNHLNLLVLFGISCKEKPYLMVMQFYGVAGKALNLKDCFRPPSVLLKTSNWLITVVQLCDALRYIHSKKIWHNDIKSDNIVMVKEENKEILYSPIFVDFGKAKNMSAVQRKQLTEGEKKVYRKRHIHIAPDVIEGSHAPSVKSDIYSSRLVF